MKRARRQVGDRTILNAALRIMRRRGPEFTLADVGSEVGLSAARLVQRFGSRRGLLMAACRHWGTIAEASLDTVIRSERPIREYLRLLGASFKGTSAAEMGGALGLIGIARADQELGRWYREFLEGQRSRFARWLEAGVAAGELTPHDVRTLADRILFLSMGHLAMMAIGLADDPSLLIDLLESELAPHRPRAFLTVSTAQVDSR